MKSETMNFGWAPYWNMLPLKQEIKRKIGSKVEFTMGHPADINKLARTGKVIAAPCSSVCLLKYPELSMPLPIGVVASKEVESVYIGFTRFEEDLMSYIEYRTEQCQRFFKQAREKYPNDPRSAAKAAIKLMQASKQNITYCPPPIYFTAASETSVALARLFWKFLFGAKPVTPDERHTEQNIAQVLIGDEALEKKHNFPIKLDLATYWRKMTGLPFVFAAWQSACKEPHPELNESLLAAAELAQAKMKIEPSSYFSTPLPKDQQGHTIDLAGYWSHLRYRLTSTDIQGLMLFLSLVCETQPKSLKLTNKLVSLQESTFI